MRQRFNRRLRWFQLRQDRPRSTRMRGDRREAVADDVVHGGDACRAVDRPPRSRTGTKVAKPDALRWGEVTVYLRYDRDRRFSQRAEPTAYRIAALALLWICALGS